MSNGMNPSDIGEMLDVGLSNAGVQAMNLGTSSAPVPPSSGGSMFGFLSNLSTKHYVIIAVVILVIGYLVYTKWGKPSAPPAPTGYPVYPNPNQIGYVPAPNQYPGDDNLRQPAPPAPQPSNNDTLLTQDDKEYLAQMDQQNPGVPPPNGQ